MSNLLLNQHRVPITTILNFCRNLSWHFRRAGAAFLRILEYPQPFEAHAANEIEKAREFRIRFTGESDDESSAQRDAGNSSAEFVNQIFDVSARCFASHPLQHGIVDMLQRNIDVARDLVALCDRFNQFVAPMRRMRIKQAHPEFAFDLLNLAKQLCEGRSPSRIDRLA